LLESGGNAGASVLYVGPRDPKVGRVSWANESVHLDNTHDNHVGFRAVSKEVWDFYIGGYQVCHKWLKERKGRRLSEDDIAHYRKIVVAISETIRLMGEIDEVIEEHGGWPDAFVTAERVGA
jgi:hypothetical protein